MSELSTAAKWSPGEIVAAVFGFPAAIAAVIKIQRELRKCYYRRTQRRTASDIEQGTLGAVENEPLSSSLNAAIDSPRLTCAGGGSPRPSRAHLTQDIRLQQQPLGREYLARDILQPLAVGMQSSEEHGRSGLRLRHHPASVSEGVPSPVITVHEHRARFQESCGSIGTSVEDVATWTWLKIQTDEANAQTARERMEWEEVLQCRGGPTEASLSWPDLSDE